MAGKFAGLIDCYICDQPADARCKSCGFGYCASHGGELCQRCLGAQGSAPSAAVFKGSLAILLATTLLALWLLISPPNRPGKLPSLASSAAPTEMSAEDAGRPSGPASPALSAGTSPVLTPLPSVRTAPTASPTVAATVTASPTATATPALYLEYSVQPGDTIYGIAERFGAPAEEIIRLNNLSNPSRLSLGQKLLIPR